MTKVEKTWFVLRDLKRINAREPAYKLLTNKGFKVFTPMEWHIREVAGQQIKTGKPILPDLLFVHTTDEDLEPLVARTPTLQFRFIKGGYHKKMTIKEDEMTRFITAVENAEAVDFFTPENITPNMIGKKVRIAEGPLCGCEVPLLKVQGARKKKILIKLSSVLYATLVVEPNQIVFLKNKAPLGEIHS